MRKKFYKSLTALGAALLLLITGATTANAQGLPNLITEPENGSTVDWFTGVAMRWGTSRLTMVNNKGFKVTHNGVDITKHSTFDFVMQIIEYCPDEQTSWEDVQLQIESTGIFPMTEEGTYVFTVDPGAVNINVDGKQVSNPQVELTYYIGKQGPAVQVPAPAVSPASGSTVSSLDLVTLSWAGFVAHQIVDANTAEPLKPITCSVNGGTPSNVEIEYIGEESSSFSDYYPTLGLQIDAKESGTYTITIPKGALYLANENAGSLENDEVVLTYTVNIPQQGQTKYMTGGAVSPANGSELDNLGNTSITWSSYTLDLGGEEFVNLPVDGVKVLINGVENTTWKNITGTGGYSFQAANSQGSNEGTGGADSFKVSLITFYPGDQAFWWKGTVQIQIPEGIVKSTTGAISPAFDLTYYVGGMNAVSPAIFSPEAGTVFDEGEGEITVSWEGYTVKSINSNKVFYNTVNEEGDNSDKSQFPANLISITDGELKIDVSTLEAGSYVLTLAQGAVSLGENDINADAQYEFRIFKEEPVEPEPTEPIPTEINPEVTFNSENGTVSITWDGNELSLTDDFSLTLTDNVTGETTEISADAVSVENGNLVIDLNGIEESDGDYTLTLGANSVNIDEDGTETYNEEVVYNFQTSGVNGIVTGSTEAVYYNLHGQRVVNPQKGIYIVNGKKVVL